MRLWRKREIPRLRWNCASRQSLEAAWKTKCLDSGKPKCLDVGTGADESVVGHINEFDITIPEACTTLDIIQKFNPDIHGDLRAIIEPGDLVTVERYPQLATILPNTFSLVRLSHFVEHIAWIHQELLLEWIYSILEPGGMVYIVTPNLEFITKIYTKNIKRIKKGLEPKYPLDEHSYCKAGVAHHMQYWTNFKLFSGCSPGDYHHTCYDEYLLGSHLVDKGFTNVVISSTTEVIAVAYKPIEKPEGLDELVKRAVQ